MNEFLHYSQLSVSELRQKAADAARQASKKGKTWDPVIVNEHSRSICKSWWGKAWCDNLEAYCDYENRLPRAKRYVRNGAVVDLKIGEGVIHAKVQGTRRTPYNVTIQIAPLSEESKRKILERCTAGIRSLDQLVNGDFPEDLKDMFTMKGGLFPTPDEISISCSCPDWAYLCKHAGAVLYGIGVRLDENPFLFFLMRQMNPDSLIEKAVTNRIDAMLENANRPSRRILSDDPAELFGL